MGHALWEDINPLCVSLSLTLCLPVRSALSLCLCLGGYRIADKAFYQQPDADVIGYVYVPLTDHILPRGVWGSWGCPAKERGDAGRYWAMVRSQREDSAAECLLVSRWWSLRRQVELLEMPLWGLLKRQSLGSCAFWGMALGVEKSWEQADTPVPLDE